MDPAAAARGRLAEWVREMANHASGDLAPHDAAHTMSPVGGQGINLLFPPNARASVATTMSTRNTTKKIQARGRCVPPRARRGRS